MRMARGDLAEQQNVGAVGLAGIGSGRIDHDRAIVSRLFLQSRVTVPPIGSALSQRGNVINEGFPRLDSGKADAGNAVELEWQKQAMPMDGAVQIGRAHV